MSDRLLSDFVSGFEAMGYRQVKGVPRYHRRDRFYRHERSTSEVGHYAVLDYKPKLGTFGVRVGVSNPEAMILLKQALPVLMKHMLPAAARLRLSDLPCWMLFDVGRALDWDLLSIPAPIDRESWPTQLKQLAREFLEPVFWPIKNAEGILELLLRDDRPFEWFANGGVLRVAEIIVLSRFAKVDPTTTRTQIARFESQVLKQMEGQKDLDGMVNELLHALQGSH